MPRNGLLCCLGAARLFVVRIPAALIAKSEASLQQIAVFAIRYAHVRTKIIVRGAGLLALERIKVKVGLHTARQHVRCDLFIAPKRAHQTASPISRGLDKSAAATGACGIRGANWEPVALEFCPPRRLAPFDPNSFRGNV